MGHYGETRVYEPIEPCKICNERKKTSKDEAKTEKKLIKDTFEKEENDDKDK
jgi:hypothetical protein